MEKLLQILPHSSEPGIFIATTSFAAITLIGLLCASGVLLIVRAFTPSHSLTQLWTHRDGHETLFSDGYREGPNGLDQRQPSRKYLNFFALSKAVHTWSETGFISELFNMIKLDADLAITKSSRAELVTYLVSRYTVISIAAIVFAAVSPKDIATSKLVLTVQLSSVALTGVAIRALKNKAAKMRLEMLESLNVFIEFVRLSAHTQSIEGALMRAAHMGTNWPFVRIARGFEQVKRHNQPCWKAFEILGSYYNVYELSELGAALENAGTEGTRVQSLLEAKARSLSRRVTEAEIEKANAATAQLSLPLGLIAVIAVAILIAPALMAF